MKILASFLILLVGCTAPSMAENDVVIQAQLAASSGYEVNLNLTAGETLEWSWQSNRMLRFDVHRHEGLEVIKSVEHRGFSHTGQLVIPHDGIWSMYWVDHSNIGANLTGTYRLLA